MDRLPANRHPLKQPMNRHPSLRRLVDMAASLRESLVGLPASVDADSLAQAVVVGAATLRMHRGLFTDRRPRDWLLDQPDLVYRNVLQRCVAMADLAACNSSAARALDEVITPLQATDTTGDLTLYLYEHFLSAYNANQRMRRGVYYTPTEVARHIVAEADRLLCDELDLPAGLADCRSFRDVIGEGRRRDRFVTILDPAAGTGAFLLAAIDHMHATYRGDDWNGFVVQEMLPRLSGCELLLPAIIVALIRITVKLAETGFSFQTPGAIRLTWGNAFDPAIVAATGVPTVILGNPPFSGISDHVPWIDALLKGTAPGGQATASYYHVHGQPLGEKKVWLQDDYVKFLRYAQWRIEQAGAGVLGFVTNHGYLDNATFRGLRSALMNDFSSIKLLDLHGNRKKHEVSPTASADENVFAIEQGVAIGMFCRDRQRRGCRVELGELWGAKSDKLRALRERACSTRRVEPRAPEFLFTGAASRVPREYARAFKLTEIMPVYTSAVVTARDHFVVAFEREELLERIQELRDASISDQNIRSRYFRNGRSRKYPPGDTRGWKLSEARQQLMADPLWSKRIMSCLYRPFDWRPIYWTERMIDWPRTEVMRELTGGQNLALIARRQMLPTQPCNFFWVTNTIPIDGILRSDNRGNESVFPLFVGGAKGKPEPNFSAAFLDTVHQVAGQDFTSEQLAGYIYGLFHATAYRERYADALRRDFPRVLVPPERDVLCQLAEYGQQLIQAHLLQRRPAAASAAEDAWPCVERGYPKHRQGRVYVNADSYFDDVEPAIWKFRAGAHQVCYKWLKDRRGRVLSPSEQQQYRTLVRAIRTTLQITARIDQLIPAPWFTRTHQTAA